MTQPTSGDDDDYAGDEPPRVAVYTDGGCDPNPGPGGWGAVIKWGTRTWTLSGSDPATTNNRMELHAAAAALALLEGLLGRCHVDIYTDSQYLRQGITEWIKTWAANDWRTREGQPVKNQDLWRLLHRLSQAHQTGWHWLKGHSGHPHNEQADGLAAQARRSISRTVGETGAHTATDDSHPSVQIHIKAFCRHSGGPGGWGAVLRRGKRARQLSGGEPATTAHAMVLRGALEALRALRTRCRVTLCSDADYLIKGATLWAEGWQTRGWRTRNGQPVAHRATWEAVLAAARSHQVVWVHVAARAEQPPDFALAGQLAEAAAAAESGADRIGSASP